MSSLNFSIYNTFDLQSVYTSAIHFSSFVTWTMFWLFNASNPVGAILFVLFKPWPFGDDSYRLFETDYLTMIIYLLSLQLYQKCLWCSLKTSTVTFQCFTNIYADVYGSVLVWKMINIKVFLKMFIGCKCIGLSLGR